MNPSSSSNNYPEGVMNSLSDSTGTLLVVPKGTEVQVLSSTEETDCYLLHLSQNKNAKLVESSTQKSPISGCTKEYYRNLVDVTEPMTLERAMNTTSGSESSSPTRPFIREKKLKFLREHVKKLQKSNRQFYDKTRRQERKIRRKLKEKN